MEAVFPVIRILDMAERILVITHVSPDGDAISSLTAFGIILSQLSKSFTLVCDDGLPERYRYLSMSDQVQTTPKTDRPYDLIVALDAGDLDRLGMAYTNLPDPKPHILNIDHHVSNTSYGTVNLVDPKANATAEILYETLPELGIELTAELATCLLTGIVTDTLSFRTAGVTAKTLQIASDLMAAGADLFTVNTRALGLKPISTLLIWKKGLDNMKMEDGLIWTSISNEERATTGHMGSSSFGLGNMLAEVYDANMSAVLLEMANGRISIGFRCRPPYIVSELAQSLGGGGHDLAAGCSLDGPLTSAEAVIVEKSKESIRRQKAALASSGQKKTV